MDHNKKMSNCYICGRMCAIDENQTGACGKYTCREGKLAEITPDKYLVVCCISIETMPVLHFRPNGKFLQITTTGCNFNCPGCVSTILVRELDQNSAVLKHMTPDELIKKAVEEDCIGISFLMNDPLASYFTFLNVAKAAKTAGLLVGCSTNGYFTRQSLDKLTPFLDFVNVGIKGFSDEEYHICGAESIGPVLENLMALYKAGVHVEVSCTYKNGGEESLEAFASWLSHNGLNIPVQIMRYIPLEGAEPELEPKISLSEALCGQLKEKLDYVYLFNTPGTALLNTYCPQCGSLLIQRDFYGPMGAKVRNVCIGADAKCPECGRDIPISGLAQREGYSEKSFEGGYPFTRALEMIQAVLVASGADRLPEVAKVWEKVLLDDDFDALHKDLNSISRYISLIEKLSALCGRPEKGNALAEYLKSRVGEIENKLKDVKYRPRVYYAMGKPLFCLNGERFENQLITAAGGLSVNMEVQGEGRPGLTITAEELTALNPEIIFISSFLSNATDDFLKECHEKNIRADAVESGRIYAHPCPNWDFGSPRWILGLMYIANILHPRVFSFDLQKEAETFYREFYNCEFNPSEINLSFSKPSTKWKWKD